MSTVRDSSIKLHKFSVGITSTFNNFLLDFGLLTKSTDLKYNSHIRLDSVGIQFFLCCLNLSL